MLKKAAAWKIICGMMALAVLTTDGQASPDLSVDTTGACPSHEEFKAVGGLLSRRGSAGLGSSAVVVDRPPIQIGSAAAAANVGFFPQKYETVTLYGTDRRGRKVFAKFQDSDKCGWIQLRHVLGGDLLNRISGASRRAERAFRKFRSGPPAMDAIKLQRLTEEEKFRLENTGLKAKISLQNLNLGAEESDSVGVPLFSAPGQPLEQSGEQKRLNLADTLLVYGEARGEHPESGQQIFYYLVGRPAGGSSRFRIHGWVSERDVVLWNTSFSAFWAGTGKAQGTVDDRWLGREDEIPVITEPNPLIVPQNRVVPYFPVIQEDEERKPPKVQVLIPGSACTEEERKNRLECRSSAQLDEDRNKINISRERLRNVDILFLIDNSESMSEYFGAAGQAISQYVSKLDTSSLNVRIGAASYGDYKNGRATLDTVQFRRIARFTPLSSQQGAERLARSLKEAARNPFSDPEEDKKEASYAAVILSAQSKWRPEAGVRIVVHLADHGNREFDRTSEEVRSDGNPKSTLVEVFSADDVITSLKRSKALYLPIAVKGDYIESENGRFVNQAKQLRKMEPRRVLPALTSYAQESGAESVAARVSSIFNALSNSRLSVLRTIQDVSREIDCAANPEFCPDDTPSGGGDQGVERTNFLAVIPTTLREDMGLTREQIENVYARTQNVLPVWFAAQSDNQEVFKYAVALGSDEVTDLDTVFAKLCSVLKRGNASTADLREALVSVTRGGSREVVEESTSVADFLEKAFAFPGQRFQTFFSISWDELLDTAQSSDPGARSRLIKGICRSSFLISKVRTQVQVTDPTQMRWDDGFGEWTIPDRYLRPFQFRVPSDIGLEFFYVPLDYFLDEPA